MFYSGGGDKDSRAVYTYIGKHIGIPIQMEVVSGNGFDAGNDGDSEEPLAIVLVLIESNTWTMETHKSKHPEEDSHDQCKE